jgi:hypothetical protein
MSDATLIIESEILVTLACMSAVKIPADILALNTIASLGFCPVKTVERRERSAYISKLIETTLTAEGL